MAKTPEKADGRMDGRTNQPIGQPAHTKSRVRKIELSMEFQVFQECEMVDGMDGGMDGRMDGRMYCSISRRSSVKFILRNSQSKLRLNSRRRRRSIANSILHNGCRGVAKVVK